jgi:hypothetical protein
MRADDGDVATRTVVLAAGVALALLAVLAGLVLRDADERSPAAPTTTTGKVRGHGRPTTTTSPNALEQPAGVARDILRDGAGAVCTALHC